MKWKSFITLPVWSIYIMIILTIVLSIVILARVWFPEAIDDSLFYKIGWSYAVLIISSALIAKMTEFLKKMTENSVEP